MNDEHETIDVTPSAIQTLEESKVIVADPDRVAQAMGQYRKIQAILDESMPECIQRIGDKDYRKKEYWRGVATAFNLNVQLVSEERDEAFEDWGYIVVYRAVAPNGRYSNGDGACFASEKASGQDSVHNVRAHAHTRAVNRAISNLVGFGEVSAEEMAETGQRGGKSTSSGTKRNPKMLNEGQEKLLWVKAKQKVEEMGYSKADADKFLHSILKSEFEIESIHEVPKGTVNDVIKAITKYEPKT